MRRIADEGAQMLQTQRSDHEELNVSVDVDSPGGSTARQQDESTLRPRKGTHLFSSDAKKQGRAAKRLAALEKQAKPKGRRAKKQEALSNRLEMVLSGGFVPSPHAKPLPTEDDEDGVSPQRLKKDGDRCCQMSSKKLCTGFLLSAVLLAGAVSVLLTLAPSDPCKTGDYISVDHKWRTTLNGYGTKGNRYHSDFHSDEMGRSREHLYQTYHGDWELEAGWYRFTGTGGDAIAVRNPGPRHCGVLYPGWLSGWEAGAVANSSDCYGALVQQASNRGCGQEAGVPPLGYSEPGSYPSGPEAGEVPRVVCFDSSGDGGSRGGPCSTPVTIGVRHCGEFLLWNLPSAKPVAPDYKALYRLQSGAYCTADSGLFTSGAGDTCRSEPCRNSGACIAGGEAGFRCECAAGYSGVDCSL